MLTQFRLFLAQLILPKGYEVADSDYAEAMATKCYFRGKRDAFFLVKHFMEGLYGTDWRDDAYQYVTDKEASYRRELDNLKPSNL